MKNILIAGLGNPGPKYELTRHNAGFICIDEFVEKTEEMDAWVDQKDMKCHISRGRIADLGVIAVKPMTFMNDSGEAIQAVSHFYKVATEQVLVVHDELDIDFGKIRMRAGGSDAGHRGIRSITQHMGEQYDRVRVGVGPKNPPQIDSIDFVLKKFTAEEQAKLPDMANEVNSILTEYIYGGGQLPPETRSFLV